MRIWLFSRSKWTVCNILRQAAQSRFQRRKCSLLLVFLLLLTTDTQQVWLVHLDRPCLITWERTCLLEGQEFDAIQKVIGWFLHNVDSIYLFEIHQLLGHFLPLEHIPLIINKILNWIRHIIFHIPYNNINTNKFFIK